MTKKPEELEKRFQKDIFRRREISALADFEARTEEQRRDRVLGNVTPTALERLQRYGVAAGLIGVLLVAAWEGGKRMEPDSKSMPPVVKIENAGGVEGGGRFCSGQPGPAK